MKDSFAAYHPLVNFSYFALVMGFSLALTHPLAQGIGLLCAASYCLTVDGKKSVRLLLKFCLPTVLLTVLVNPAFQHEGVTVLLYLPNGNPLTLESILYGLLAGVLLVTMLLWFSSFQRVMTSDKFIYLFGRIIPALSLVLSMTLRFVPKFKDHLSTVSDAQRCLGRDVSRGSVLRRTKTAVTIFSATVTWALENAIETADSMKSRGYGLKGRTAFSVYLLEPRDRAALGWLFFCGMVLASGAVLSVFAFRCYPSIRYAALDASTLPFYAVYLCLCATPVFLNAREERKWNTLYSKM